MVPQHAVVHRNQWYGQEWSTRYDSGAGACTPVVVVLETSPLVAKCPPGRTTVSVLLPPAGGLLLQDDRSPSLLGRRPAGPAAAAVKLLPGHTAQV